MKQREIKFRAWDGDNMQPWEAVQSWHFNWVESVTHTFMQFTGLLDKNGKEIYEGDILAFNLPITGADGEPDFTEITARIDFQGGAFWFTGGGYTDCNWHFYNSKDREVIGNIYEHPELLTK